VLRLAHDTAHLLHARDPAFPAAPPLPTLEYRDEFVGAGYAESTDAGREAIALAHDLEGWKIDTTYSGKALACLVADARAGRLAESVPVFWQTWNSRPYPPGIADVGPRKVPEALRKFLA
jgi:D-cysteine desulfhydrase